MEKYCLSVALIKLLNLNNPSSVKLEILENILLNYIRYNMGYKLNDDYTDYFKTVEVYLKSIADNLDNVTLDNICFKVGQYINSNLKKLQKNFYVESFINAVKQRYTNDIKNVAVRNFHDTYEIFMCNKDESNIDISSTIIMNINELQTTLENYLNAILNSNSLYKNIITDLKNDTLEKIFFWTVINANIYELKDVNKLFIRYIDYLNDDYYNLEKKPKKYGMMNDDSIYFKYDVSDLAFETPYFTRFFIVDEKDNLSFELPNIRFGFRKDENEEIECQILAIQTSQTMNSSELCNDVMNFFKFKLKKTSKFREFNPSHMISLLLFIGMLEGMNVKSFKISEYMPFRFKRFFNDNLDLDVVKARQYRITKKMINNFKKLTLYFSNIEEDFESLNEIGFNIIGPLSANDDFIDNLISIGRKIGLENVLNKTDNVVRTRGLL